MATERLRVILEMVTSNYKKGAQDAARATDGITKSGQAADKSVSGLSGRLDGFKSAAKAAAGAAAAGALVAVLSDSARAASDLGESINAVEKVFGGASETITTFGESSAQAVGLAASEFNQLATGVGSLLGNFGFTAQEAANETIKLTTRAADLASVFNTDVDQAVEAVGSALRGETEPIRKFGVSLDAASIAARAVELGLAESTSQVDKNAKATAALSLIYEQTNKAAGDFAQTSDSLANSQRIAAAEFENAKARLGQGLTPVLAAGTNALASFVTQLQNLAGSDAANQSVKIRTAILEIQEAAGDDAKILKFQDALVDVAAEADLTTGVILALANAAGIPAEKLPGATDELLAMARAAGVAEPVVAEMEAALRGLEPAADGAGEAVGDLGDEAGDAAKETDRLKDSTVNLATELRKQADPIFRAVSAFQDYQNTLAEIDEDGERTAEELLDLADAVLTSEEALSELGGGNLERGIQVIADAIDLTTQEVRDLLRELGILDGTNFTVTGTVIRATATAAEQGTIDPSIAAAARRAGRAFGGSVSASTSYIVGERGPELFRPSGSGRIEPISRAVAGGDTGVVINLNVTTEPGFSNQVVREMEQALSRYGRGVS